MTLSRYIPTRLLRAAHREAVACFGQASLGLQSSYQHDNGEWKIYAFPLIVSAGKASVTPCQIHVYNTPQSYEQGVGGVNETRHDIQYDFYLPVNMLQFDTETDGTNTYLDHIYALREWLVRGGTWAERIGRKINGSGIEDPEAEGESLGNLTRFEWQMPDDVPSGIVVPVSVTYQTREDAEGVKR